MLGSILGNVAGAAVGGLLGGGKKGGRESLQGFAAYPEEIKTFLLEQYFPRLQAIMNRGYQAMPMRRVSASDYPDPAFMPRAAMEWQQYSDSVGGLFPSMVGRQTQATAQPTQPVVNLSQLSTLLPSYGGGKTPALQNDNILKMLGMQLGGSSGR